MKWELDKCEKLLLSFYEEDESFRELVGSGIDSSSDYEDLYHYSNYIKSSLGSAFYNSGATKVALLVTNEDFVIKIPFREYLEEDPDYQIDSEPAFYEMTEDRLKPMLAATSPFRCTTFDDGEQLWWYLMERAEIDPERVRRESSSALQEESSSYYQGASEICYRSDYKNFAVMALYYDEELVVDLEDYMKEYNVFDFCHSHNIGYRAGRPVIIDYSIV